jgi:hypothetical protein
MPIDRLSPCCICGLIEQATEPYESRNKPDQVKRIRVLKGLANSLETTFICGTCDKLSNSTRERKANRRQTHLEEERANGIFWHPYTYACDPEA